MKCFPVALHERIRAAWLLTALLVPLLSLTGRRLLRWVDGWIDRPVLGFVFAVLLVTALVWAVSRLRRRPWVIGAAAVVAAGMMLWWVSRGEERLHLLLFGALGYLGVSTLGPWRALAACGVLAVGDEVLQAALPDRVGDVRDVGMNLAAAVVGWLLAVGAR